MQVTAERGGGLDPNNHQVLGPIDTDDPDIGTRGEIVALLEELDFFNMADPEPSTGHKDGGWSSLRVVDGDKDRTVRWTDGDDVPTGLQAVVSKLETLADWT